MGLNFSPPPLCNEKNFSSKPRSDFFEQSKGVGGHFVHICYTHMSHVYFLYLAHGGVLDVRGRPHFSRFDPRPERPHFSNFGPPAVGRPFCKKVFGHGEKAWFSRFGRPRGAVGHFSRFGAHLPPGAL